MPGKSRASAFSSQKYLLRALVTKESESPKNWVLCLRPRKFTRDTASDSCRASSGRTSCATLREKNLPLLHLTGCLFFGGVAISQDRAKGFWFPRSRLREDSRLIAYSTDYVPFSLLCGTLARVRGACSVRRFCFWRLPLGIVLGR